MNRRIDDTIGRLALQRTIFYTPSEWADIGRLWRFGGNPESILATLAFTGLILVLLWTKIEDVKKAWSCSRKRTRSSDR